LLLQSYYWGNPSIGVLIFGLLYLAMLIGLLIWHKIGRVTRRRFWGYFAALHIIMMPLIIISWLALIGIIPVGIWDAIIQFIDLILP